MTELIRKFKDSSFDRKLLNILLLGLSAFLVLAYALSAFRSMVNADAGYYLGVTELIHEGYVPYRDFRLGYTPLLFYFLQLPRLFMGTYPDYNGYMLSLYFIVALDAFLLAIIIKRVSNSFEFAWLSTLVFLALYLYLDGSYFIIEPFSLCWGLLSMVILVVKDISPWRCLCSGACCALAFWSKQYGLLFAGVIGVLLLFMKGGLKTRIINCLFSFAGFCVVFFLIASLFVMSGMEMKDLVRALSGSTYGGQSLSLYVKGIVKTCQLFPYLLFIPALLFIWKNHEAPLVWGCSVGLLLASFQFYFNVFPHYYIFMLPFVIVLNAMMWRWLKDSNKVGVCFLLYFGLFFTACAIPFQSVYKDTRALAKHDSRFAQDETTIQLRQIVRDYQLDSALCYWNTIQYYGLCPIKPSSIEDSAFSFGYDTEESYVFRLKDADSFIINKKDFKEISQMKTLSTVLFEQFQLLNQSFYDGTEVFVRIRDGVE